jgi:hypothetical protein
MKTKMPSHATYIKKHSRAIIGRPEKRPFLQTVPEPSETSDNKPGDHTIDPSGSATRRSVHLPNNSPQLKAGSKYNADRSYSKPSQK